MANAFVIPMITITAIFVAILISHSSQIPSRHQKTKCDIEEEYDKIFEGQICPNFESFGKFRNNVYGIELKDFMSLEQWTINKSEAVHVKVDTHDQAVTKLVKHHRNNSDVWVVFESNSEHYLLHWRLEKPSKTNLWELTKESVADFVFQNHSLLVVVFSSTTNELLVQQHKFLDMNAKPDELKIVTLELDAKNVKVTDKEISLTDANFNVIKIHFQNMAKFWNVPINGGGSNENSHFGMLHIGVFIVGCVIGGGFVAFTMYFILHKYYKVIKIPRSSPRPNSKFRRHETEMKELTLHREIEESMIPIDIEVDEDAVDGAGAGAKSENQDDDEEGRRSIQRESHFGNRLAGSMTMFHNIDWEQIAPRLIASARDFPE